MNILALETSFDETAAAIVNDKREILANEIATSQDIHAQTGGAIPENAARQQLISILPIIKRTLEKANLSKNNIDKIAVTYGPGLIGSLLVGVETAKTLSLLWNKPLIPVNHLTAHLYANWTKDNNPEFPLLGVVVSGGHTDFILMKSHTDTTWLGGTRDDAAGEAFDKTARLLNLGYPGGPAIGKKAQLFIDKNPSKKLDMFPRPMIHEDNLDVSFSGLKTAVSKQVKNAALENQNDTEELSAQVQEAIVDTLIAKIAKSVEIYNPKSIILGGGVSANTRLKEKLKQKTHFPTLFIPEPKYCTDNAVCIGLNALFSKHTEISWRSLTANPQLNITDTA